MQKALRTMSVLHFFHSNAIQFDKFCTYLYKGTNWGKWYYFNSPSGYMLANEWHDTSPYWYYLKSDGAMAEGWLELPAGSKKWYYCRKASDVAAMGGKQGAMLANGSWKIGSKVYNFNASSVCTNPSQESGV